MQNNTYYEQNSNHHTFTHKMAFIIYKRMHKIEYRRWFSFNLDYNAKIIYRTLFSVRFFMFGHFFLVVLNRLTKTIESFKSHNQMHNHFFFLLNFVWHLEKKMSKKRTQKQIHFLSLLLSSIKLEHS